VAKRSTKRSGRQSAAGLDKTLADVSSRLASWRKVRDALVAQLEDVVRTGQRMLEELGATSASSGPARRSGGRKGTSGSRRLSPEGRARIIAAAKKRWAKYNRAKKKANKKGA
jgi:hypothetical protein